MKSSTLVPILVAAFVSHGSVVFAQAGPKDAPVAATPVTPANGTLSTLDIAAPITTLIASLLTSSAAIASAVADPNADGATDNKDARTAQYVLTSLGDVGQNMGRELAETSVALKKLEPKARSEPLTTKEPL